MQRRCRRELRGQLMLLFCTREKGEGAIGRRSGDLLTWGKAEEIGAPLLHVYMGEGEYLPFALYSSKLAEDIKEEQ
jgi:hypothetical protein